MMMTAMSCSLMMLPMLSQVILKTMVFLLVATRYFLGLRRGAGLVYRGEMGDNGKEHRNY